jgi:large subunit ribosomal protein L29
MSMGIKPADLRAMDDAQLATKLNELSEERFRLRFRQATETLENPMRFRVLRREIARIQTIQRERAGGLQ